MTRVLRKKNRLSNDQRFVEQKLSTSFELGHKCEFTDLGNRKSHANVCLGLIGAWLDIEVAWDALSIRST